MKKRLGLAAVIFITIAIVYEFCNTVQTSVVVRKIKKSNTSVYEEECVKLTNTYALLLDATLAQYFKMLDVYVNSVPEESDDSDDILGWFENDCAIHDKDFDYVAFVNEEGEFFGNNGSHTTVNDRGYFKAVMQNRQESFVSGADTSKTTGKNVIHLCRAVKIKGRTVGFFTGILQVEKMDNIIRNLTLGKTGGAIILDSDNGFIATSGNNERILSFISDPMAQPKTVEMQNRIARGESGTMWVPVPTMGTEIFNVYHPVGDSGWKLFFVIEKSQMFESAYEVMNVCIAAGSITGILLVLNLGILVNRRVKPLRVPDESLKEIAAGAADLSQRIEVPARDKTEIASVIESFNTFIGKMQEMIISLKDSKTELSSTGRELSDSTESTASAITQITASIQNLGSNIFTQTASVEETSSAINQISTNIKSMNKMVVSQSSCIAEASAAVEQMIGNIASVKRSMEKMSGSFNMLEQKSLDGVQKQKAVNERIRLIEAESKTLQQANSVISSIASQTNLLAMNAAIEAAHAGSSGQGFSVVADEIRKLSETSSTQSKTIGMQLKKIVESINGIVDASVSAEAAFSEVNENLSCTDSIVHEISNAMEEQAEGSKQITLALHLMTDSSTEVENASTEMTAGANAILEEIHRLEENTLLMKNAMDEMSIGTKKVNDTASMLQNLSGTVQDSIFIIGSQVDRFDV